MPMGEKITRNAEAETSLAGVPLRFTVNGQPYELMVKPNWSLQYVLHDKLAFTSVKDMCVGKGECGACTAIIDKRPVLSCMILAVECNGKVIETAEGIVASGHPLVETYVKNHCMQCGYCTPGFLVTAKALLDRNPDPTEDEVIEALGDNLCRCGTYPRHPIAVLEAAKMLRGGA
jgi:aerobic-type carbon monoxide dehydrogenase small subunit (CoxS/CutS family)